MARWKDVSDFERGFIVGDTDGRRFFFFFTKAAQLVSNSKGTLKVTSAFRSMGEASVKGGKKLWVTDHIQWFDWMWCSHISAVCKKKRKGL